MASSEEAIVFTNRVPITFIGPVLLVAIALAAIPAGAQSPSPGASAFPAARSPAPTPASLPPEGRWQVVLSTDELVAAGAPLDGATAGTYTWTFDGDRARIDLEPEEGEGSTAAGRWPPSGIG